MKKKNQHQVNLEIEALVKQKGNKAENYSLEEREFLLQYEGSGGQGKHGATGEGVLYEFYTPMYICGLMWELARHYGFDGGSVLEPSCATGRLFHHAPDKSKCVGFEINKTSAAIAEISYPGIKVYPDYFETAFMEKPRNTSRISKGLTWLNEYPFSLVMGNPPYGKYKNFFSGYFNRPKLPQVEQFFFYYGLKMLKPGGLLVYLVSSNFLRNGISYGKAKDEIGKLATLLDAYRLPPVFRFSEVPVDILVLRRKIGS